jgi:3'-5' exoribonuclease
MDKIEGFPPQLKTAVQHLLISHHGQYEFGSPKLPMIREALVFHYLDDLDSKLSAVRIALAMPSGDEEWSAYSSALGRRFLKLDQFLKAGAAKSQSASAAASAASETPKAERRREAPKAEPKREGPGFLRKLFS